MSSWRTILEAASALSNIDIGEADKGRLLEHCEELTTALDSLHSLVTHLRGTPDVRDIPSATPAISPATAPAAIRATSPATAAPTTASPAATSASAATPATSPAATNPSAATPATSPATAAPTTASPAATTSPATAAPTATSATAPPTTASPAATSPATTGPLAELFRLLEKRESKILECFQKEPKAVIESQTDWSKEDPRFTDICQATNEDRASTDTNLRSGLSAISLADEYTEWEHAEGLESRIDQLCSNLNCGTKGSNIKKFVEHRGFSNPYKARKCLRYGIEFRVFLRIYSTCSESTAESLGMAGIVSFCFRTFVRTKYCDMPLLAELLASSKWKEIATNKDEWMSSCFQLYQERVRSIILSRKRLTQPPEPEGQRKRQIQESDLSDFTFPGQDSPFLIFNPIGHPYVEVNQQQNTLFTPPLNLNPAGQPYDDEPSHDSSPFTLPSEQIAAEVQNFISNIPTTDDYGS
ncbi:hypothetical protein BDW69DRAFT_100893 [Aspergillus filifer]